MTDRDKLEQLLSDGYLIADPLPSLERLRDVNRFRSFFHIETPVEKLVSAGKRGESLWILGHPLSGKRVEILTSDKPTLSRIERQLAYQNETIGTLLRVRCAAVDHSHGEKQICHGLDRLVQSLDGFSGWKVTLLDATPPAFQIEARVMSTDPNDADEARANLKTLLDCLAVSEQVGFYVQDLTSGPLRRCPLNPYVLAVGPTERLLDAVTLDQLRGIQAILLSPRARAAARGLNQAYVENFQPSRLSMLWAAAETVFDTDPTCLLAAEEVAALLAAAENIGSLGNDPSRMQELKSALSSPQRLPLLGRNKRMAREMASAMAVGEEEAYAELRKASELRGKEPHRLSVDRGNLASSIDFLQRMLRLYLAKQGIP